MPARSLAVVLALAVVLVALWLVPRRERGTAEAPSSELHSVEERVTPALEPAVATADRLAIEPEVEEEPLDEDDADPPTPERPGPGQALLRVEVVALETGKPIAGATVGLFEDGDREWAFSEQSDPSRGVEGDDVVTNAAGRGEFVVQVGHAYLVRARGPPGRAGEAEVELDPLREGEERDARIASITAYDFLWHGRVVEGDTDLPLVGAEVVVLAYAGAETIDELGPELARGRCDGDGRLSLRLPSWEPAIARASATGYFWGGCEVREGADSIERAATMTLRRPGGLAVQVLGTDGRPVGDLEVGIRTKTFELFENAFLLDDVEWSGATDSDGRCPFSSLPAGIRLLVEVGRGSRVLLRARCDEPLSPGELRSMELHLEAGCRVTGVVHDRDGNPQTGVPLTLVSLQRPLWTGRLHDGDITSVESWIAPEQRFASLESDAEGRFTIDDVAAGPWALGPMREADDFPAAQVVFEIAPGQGAKEIELEIDRGLRIRGVVLDPAGQPAGELPVRCEGKVPSRARFGNWGSSEMDGTFDIGPVLAGEYWVRANPDDPMHGRSDPTSASAGDEGVVVKLRWAGVLEVTVVDAESSEPTEARVTLLGHHLMGDDTEFEFTNLLPGRHDLVARTKDGRIGVLTALVKERARTDGLVIPVKRGAKLHTKTHAAEGVFYRILVQWEGADIGFEWGDLDAFLVPPGRIVVRWYRVNKEGSETFEHEEFRAVESGQEITVERH